MDESTTTAPTTTPSSPTTLTTPTNTTATTPVKGQSNSKQATVGFISSPLRSTSSSSASSSSSSSSYTSSSTPNAPHLKKSKSVSALIGPPLILPVVDIIHPQNHRGFAPFLPLGDASGLGMGMGNGQGAYGNMDSLCPPLESPQHKTFQESHEELMAKLTDLAIAKNGGRLPSSSGALFPAASTSPSFSSNTGTTLNANQSAPVIVNKHLQNVLLRSKENSGSASNFNKPKIGRRLSKNNGTPGNGGQTNTIFSSSGTNSSGRSEPRRRINSAQFRTPSAADMQELAQVVVANATPPKSQSQKKVIRKKPSILSMTTTTFGAPITNSANSSNSHHPQRHQPSYHNHNHNHNPNYSHSHKSPNLNNGTPRMPMGSGVSLLQTSGDPDYRLRYEAAMKEIQAIEKRFSALQQQLAYERDCWQEKYNELESRYEEQQTIRAEAQIEKMNDLLDTVQELQLANECFRRQLKAADIEPDATPAADFHSQYLIADDDDDIERSILEENKRIGERSKMSNKYISAMSTEITNSCVAISQAVNCMQLRFLTQALHAAEHVTTQTRSKAMSNSFLSDMLSRGVKKHSTALTGPYPHYSNTMDHSTRMHHPHHLQHASRTVAASTQTPPSITTPLRTLEEQQQFQLCQRGAGSLGGSSRFTQSLLNLVGLQHYCSMSGHPHASLLHQPCLCSASSQLYATEKEQLLYQLQYRGRSMSMVDRGRLDDRSQSIVRRSGVPTTIVQDLKGGPSSPVNTQLEDAISNKHLVPVPKFQYASPTTSQLRIVVPDVSFLGIPSTSSSSSSSVIMSTAPATSAAQAAASRSNYHHHRHEKSDSLASNPYYFGRLNKVAATTATTKSSDDGDDHPPSNATKNWTLTVPSPPIQRSVSASDIRLQQHTGTTTTLPTTTTTTGTGTTTNGSGSASRSSSSSSRSNKYTSSKTRYPYPHHHSSSLAATASSAAMGADTMASSSFQIGSSSNSSRSSISSITHGSSSHESETSMTMTTLYPPPTTAVPASAATAALATAATTPTTSSSPGTADAEATTEIITGTKPGLPTLQVVGPC
ncbi:hypothetical protein DFQ27_001733 [Actinomortierella ambigua]|uniref:Uncharacterized protein n=1 Tax=Actinomortierella ambigua TaxID=1343610 RepID=A0A9P6UBW4_9FUNG|nr:hypothetical protein DFQ27_001733 [Actinomortierella ambigua]